MQPLARPELADDAWGRWRRWSGCCASKAAGRRRRFFKLLSLTHIKKQGQRRGGKKAGKSPSSVCSPLPLFLVLPRARPLNVAARAPLLFHLLNLINWVVLFLYIFPFSFLGKRKHSCCVPWFVRGSAAAAAAAAAADTTVKTKTHTHHPTAVVVDVVPALFLVVRWQILRHPDAVGRGQHTHRGPWLRLFVRSLVRTACHALAFSLRLPAGTCRPIRARPGPLSVLGRREGLFFFLFCFFLFCLSASLPLCLSCHCRP